MNDRERLTQLLRGSRNGFTRAELKQRLQLSDRATRDLIAETVTAGHLPILSPDGDDEGRYRLARVDDIEAVNAEHHRTISRALSLHARAKGLLNAFQTYHQSGFLFTPETPEMAP